MHLFRTSDVGQTCVVMVFYNLLTCAWNKVDMSPAKLDITNLECTDVIG